MVAVALLVTGVVALLAYLAWDDARVRQSAALQAQRADDVDRQLAASRAEVDLLKKQVASMTAQTSQLQAQNNQLQTQLRSPTLAMWNSCKGPCTISSGGVRLGSVPDTFQLQINFSSDAPVRVYVLSFHQWTEFDSCGLSTRCVAGAFTAYGPATSMQQNFDDAEGCAGYVWVLQADSDATVKPDFKVRYMPAAQPTGVCAGSP
jgi:hypothetical protein